jgi:hypothetical protein
MMCFIADHVSIGSPYDSQPPFFDYGGKPPNNDDHPDIHGIVYRGEIGFYKSLFKSLESIFKMRFDIKQTRAWNYSAATVAYAK